MIVAASHERRIRHTSFVNEAMEVIEFRIARVVARAIGADRRDFAAAFCPHDLGVDDPYYEPRVDVDVIHIRCARAVAEALHTGLLVRPRGPVAAFGEECFAIALHLLERALCAAGDGDRLASHRLTPNVRDAPTSRTCRLDVSERSAC